MSSIRWPIGPCASNLQSAASESCVEDGESSRAWPCIREASMPAVNGGAAEVPWRCLLLLPDLQASKKNIRKNNVSAILSDRDASFRNDQSSEPERCQPWQVK